MRYKEFTTELIQPEIKQQKGFTKTHTDELGLIWTAHSRGEFDLTVDVQSPHMGQIAYITLEVNPDEDSMSSIDTWVHQKFRRMGIATKMYNWAEKLGNTVVASSTLSRMGKKFWKSRVSEDADQPSYQQVHQGYVIRIYPRGFTIHKDNELVLKKEMFIGSIVDKLDIKIACMAVERIAQAAALKRRQTKVD